MEYSLCSDDGIIVTSSLSSSSSSFGSSSSSSTDNQPSPPASPPASLDLSLSSSSSNSPPPDLPPDATSSPSSSRFVLRPLKVVMTRSCAACTFLGQICTENCVLATYFPPNDATKFTTVHRVYGATNVIKFLQELPESQREEAVHCMVYEAGARLRDPVYGCVGSIFALHKQVFDLQVLLSKAQAEINKMQFQKAYGHDD